MWARKILINNLNDSSLKNFTFFIKTFNHTEVFIKAAILLLMAEFCFYLIPEVLGFSGARAQTLYIYHYIHVYKHIFIDPWDIIYMYISVYTHMDRNTHKVCPEGIQPFNMKKRHLLKIQETLYIGQRRLSPLPSRCLGTSHSSPSCHQPPHRILLNLIDDLKSLPFQR